MCGCNKRNGGNSAAAQGNAALPGAGGMLLLEYVGAQTGRVAFRVEAAKNSFRKYHFGGKPAERQKFVDAGDSRKLLAMTDEKGQPLFRIVDNANQAAETAQSAKPITAGVNLPEGFMPNE